MQDKNGDWREVGKIDGGIAYDPMGNKIGSTTERPMIKITDPVKVHLPGGSVIHGIIDGFQGAKISIMTLRSTRPDFSRDPVARQAVDNHVRVVKENMQLRMLLGIRHMPGHDADVDAGNATCVCKKCNIDFMADPVEQIFTKLQQVSAEAVSQEGETGA